MTTLQMYTCNDNADGNADDSVDESHSCTIVIWMAMRKASTEANTLRCIAEVPVFVNYLLFFPTHHPLGIRQHGNIKPSEV